MKSDVENIASEFREVYKLAFTGCPQPCEAGNNPISYTIENELHHTCGSEFLCHVMWLCDNYSRLLQGASPWETESIVERFYGELIAVSNSFDQHQRERARVSQLLDNLGEVKKRGADFYEKLLKVAAEVEPHFDSHNEAYYREIARRMYPDWQGREGGPVSPKTAKNNLSIATRSSS